MTGNDGIEKGNCKLRNFTAYFGASTRRAISKPSSFDDWDAVEIPIHSN